VSHCERANLSRCVASRSQFMEANDPRGAIVTRGAANFSNRCCTGLALKEAVPADGIQPLPVLRGTDQRCSHPVVSMFVFASSLGASPRGRQVALQI
jgi:hypothetical protein